MAWYDDEFPAYVSVRERRARASLKAAGLSRQGRTLAPVKIDGLKIARTFWGQAWCTHLERYSDFSNRLPRGRSYARNGSVIDLQLSTGQVRALVSGSSVYEVTIDIEPLKKARWASLVDACTGQIDSVIELLSGKLSDGVMQLLCDPLAGLFPSSTQLELDCSCPDSARLCKHLAAVLYGVGARLDREPELLFVLRGVDQFDLVGDAAGAGLSQRTAAAEVDRDELASIFGIELEPAAAPVKAKPGRRKPAARAKTARPVRRPRARSK